MTADPARSPHGARLTSRRREVLAQLQSDGGFADATSIHAAMRAGGSRIGIATVYRALHHLVEQGAAEVRIEAGRATFRRTGDAIGASGAQPKR